MRQIILDLSAILWVVISHLKSWRWRRSAFPVWWSRTALPLQAAAPANVYPTKDGNILLQIVGFSMFKRWAKMVGKPEWITDVKYATDIKRAEHTEVDAEAKNGSRNIPMKRRSRSFPNLNSLPEQFSHRVKRWKSPML